MKYKTKHFQNVGAYMTHSIFIDYFR